MGEIRVAVFAFTLAASTAVLAWALARGRRYERERRQLEAELAHMGTWPGRRT
jgi:Flp pilus assembly protein TadB